MSNSKWWHQSWQISIPFWSPCFEDLNKKISNEGACKIEVYNDPLPVVSEAECGKRYNDKSSPLVFTLYKMSEADGTMKTWIVHQFYFLGMVNSNGPNPGKNGRDFT